MPDYDQRQYYLMLDRLNAFEAGKIQIDTLIGDLRGLVQSLQSVTDTWKNDFMLEWADLEIARGVALHREVRHFKESEIKIIREATSKLKLMVLQNIADPADNFRKP